jgi:ATP-dependent DNA helicase RecQ
VRELVEEVLSSGDEFDVSYHELSAAHDIRILIVRTLLTYLELLGYLEGGTPFYSKYQFQPLVSSQEILSQYEGERRSFLASVFREAVPAKKWFSIDVDQAAAAVGSTRDRVVRALDYLGEKQELQVKAQGVRNRYRRRKPCDDLDGLVERLHHKALEREQRDIARLQQVLDLAGQQGCQWEALCSYFGETLAEPCGHCTSCMRGEQRVEIPARPRPAIDDEILQQADELRREFAEVFSEPQALTRFLCGLTSPALTKAKLPSHPLFGALAHVPFPDLLARVSSRS